MTTDPNTKRGLRSRQARRRPEQPALALLAGLLVAATPGLAQDGSFAPAESDVSQRTEASGRQIPVDSTTVSAVVDRFHAALAAGDSATVVRLLAEDALILENGVVETRTEYLGGHLRSDIAFAQAVATERTPIRVTISGDAAWVVSTSVSRGEFRGRPVNSAGAELVILRRVAEGWRIAAIHWSARTLRE